MKPGKEERDAELVQDMLAPGTGRFCHYCLWKHHDDNLRHVRFTCVTCGNKYRAHRRCYTESMYTLCRVCLAPAKKRALQMDRQRLRISAQLGEMTTDTRGYTLFKGKP